ncbi:MAG: tyrosine decarboxylase MfnA [Candidatus Altiarchaeales archaeon]|nr:tyrosine decarboxylase MfnA [Candidatus Altiarchaeales archaeon]
MDRDEIIKKLRELRGGDLLYEDGRILSSVSTKPPGISVEAFEIFSDTNALDTHVFKGVKRMEDEVIQWFGSVLHNPGVAGYITTGGTEANIMALYVAREMNPEKREIIVPESAHYSIERAASLMDLRVSWVPLDEDFRADLSAVEARINRDTLAVIATAGTSALGVIDPIKEMSELCGDVFFHVDAAFGGFVIPFLDRPHEFDFRLSGVDSITIDPHKMGMAPIPAGSIFFRDMSYLEALKIKPTYLPFSTYTLSGSRSGGSIAAVWAVINYLGIEGYRRIIRECMRNTEILCGELKKISEVRILVEPEINFVAITVEDVERVWDTLRGRGWDILLDERSGSMRIVVMPHVTEDSIKDFVRDLREIV